MGGPGGRSPPGGGFWGCAPFTPTEVSLFEKGRPSPTLIKAGGGGEAPMAGGVGGVPPQNQNRGRVAHNSNPATSGAQNPGEPSAYEGGENTYSPHGKWMHPKICLTVLSLCGKI
jgi:hypothetical protein